jgi:hypothetical protein
MKQAERVKEYSENKNQQEVHVKAHSLNQEFFDMRNSVRSTVVKTGMVKG